MEQLKRCMQQNINRNVVKRIRVSQSPVQALASTKTLKAMVLKLFDSKSHLEVIYKPTCTSATSVVKQIHSKTIWFKNVI